MGWIRAWRAKMEAEETISERTMPEEYPVLRLLIAWTSVYERTLQVILDTRNRGHAVRGPQIGGGTGPFLPTSLEAWWNNHRVVVSAHLSRDAVATIDIQADQTPPVTLTIPPDADVAQWAEEVFGPALLRAMHLSGWP